MDFPDDRRYTKEHEWARIEGTTVRIGITDYAQQELGDIVFVELPEPGKEFKAGDSFATLESVKAASDVYAPVAGEVTAANDEVVAVSDLFPDRCAALAQACRCEKTYPSLEELVKDDSIEAVFVATDAPSQRVS